MANRTQGESPQRGTDGQLYDCVVDDADQLQFERQHSDGAETMVVAIHQENGSWKVRAVTYGHLGNYRKDLGEHPSKDAAREEMERWVAKHPNGIEPTGLGL